MNKEKIAKLKSQLSSIFDDLDLGVDVDSIPDEIIDIANEIREVINAG